MLDDGLLQDAEVGRAAAVVDVEAVGLRADRDDLEPGVAQGLGPGDGGGAVGAVDDDLEPAQVPPVEHVVGQVVGVALPGVGRGLELRHGNEIKAIERIRATQALDEKRNRPA